MGEVYKSVYLSANETIYNCFISCMPIFLAGRLAETGFKHFLKLAETYMLKNCNTVLQFIEKTGHMMLKKSVPIIHFNKTIFT